LRRKLIAEANRRGINAFGTALNEEPEPPPLPPTEEEIASRAPQSFGEFAQSTLAFPLHDWQRKHLCPLLDRLRYERGLRILLHGPPQFGKSILVSQRLTPYLVGHDPLHRVGLACYNETHAGNFGYVVKELMASAEYAEMFPRSVISKNVSSSEFSTGPRRSLRDGQHSFTAMGLLSGFVGRGVDTLLIDDPYKSAADAESEAINNAVWRWWTATARPRIGRWTNVVVMYHSYHDDDFAARLKREGGWEHYRFAAIADGKPVGIDPTGREVGEVLSPMRSLEELEIERAAQPLIFAAQFQGLPSSQVGSLFKGEIKFIERPTDIVKMVRAWDIASTPGGGDYTAGFNLALRKNGRFCLLDGTLLQAGPEEVDEAVLTAARTDGRSVRIHLAQDPGSAGVRDAASLAKKLAGYSVTVTRVSGSKLSRARPFASQVNLGNVDAVDVPTLVTSGPYKGMSVMQALLKMLAAFPHSNAKKDGVDAVADAFNELNIPTEEDKPVGYLPSQMVTSTNRR
jgi:predicted phage terminase large subunit-like protein